MERGVTYRSLIEYFLLMQNGGNGNTLVYYDQEGTRFEKPIERGHIESALQRFDGTPKAVTRSSGGLVRAAPYQLVLCEEENANGEMVPQPKIRVKFREFKKDGQGRVLPDQVQTVSKLVDPKELIDLFSYRLDGPQRFIIDVGRGIIPIYVFRFASDSQGKAYALYIELEDLEKSVKGKEGSAETHPVTIYRIHRDLLRYACVSNSCGFDEYDLALQNYRTQKQDGKVVIPEALCCGQVEIASHFSHSGLRRHLAKELKRCQILEQLTWEAHTKVVEVAEKEPAPLVPFGIYETT